MGRPAAKFALSLPDDLFREVERLRKRRRTTRSGVVQDALRFWLRHAGEAAMVREWEEGYRRMPEDRGDVDSARATAGFAFDVEDDW
ncbi:MAG: ribbon-helix-helix protein, CopG family [Candidatus Binatia bacterium]